jgi:hypothetical protein
VASSCQSNGGALDQGPTTGRPRAVSRSATRRPVLPVPPRTNVVFSSVFSVMPSVKSRPVRRAIVERLNSMSLRLH